MTRSESVKAARDPLTLLYYLSEGIHGNTGGMGRPAVYARAKFGTKDLITNYIAELADAIEQAAAVDESVMAAHRKARHLSSRESVFRPFGLDVERRRRTGAVPPRSDESTARTGSAAGRDFGFERRFVRGGGHRHARRSHATRRDTSVEPGRGIRRCSFG